MNTVIDTATNVGEHAEDLARAGVQCVMRYYNHRNVNLPEKRLLADEAKRLTEAGLSIGVVFQQRGGAGGHINDFELSDAKRDAERALELADALKQPSGSAIYFAVDHDYIKPAHLDAITEYFAEVKRILNGNYRLGAYGSGHVLQRLLDHDLTDLSWLSQSTGWTGHHKFIASQNWALLQGPVTQWPAKNFSYDPNKVNPAFADFGQFNLANPAAPQSVLSTTRALYQVIARSGLNMRRGPGTEYSDIAAFPKDTIVAGLSRSGNWIQVDIDGDGYADGYMHGGYLRLLAGGVDTHHGTAKTPYEFARQELSRNVAEYPGKANNPRIMSYHASTDKGAPDATPWCSSFVNWCVEQSGLQGTDSKWAMSWHDSDWGLDVSDDPQEGDIAVYERRWTKKDGTKAVGGHVGFVVSTDAKTVSLLGGNQSNRVSISAYPRSTGKKGSQSYKLLSFRRAEVGFGGAE